MASGRVCGMLLLLLCGVAILGENSAVGIVKACPQYCLDVSYVTCPSSGDEHLSPKCNCCLAPKGCVLHLSDGSSITCS